MKAIFTFKGKCCPTETVEEVEGSLTDIIFKTLRFMAANVVEGHGFDEMHVKLIKDNSQEGKS